MNSLTAMSSCSLNDLINRELYTSTDLLLINPNRLILQDLLQHTNIKHVCFIYSRSMLSSDETLCLQLNKLVKVKIFQKLLNIVQIKVHREIEKQIHQVL